MSEGTPDFAIFKRNEHGLLCNVDYIYKPDGRIDWRKMIKIEYLAFQRNKLEELFKEYEKPIEEINKAEVNDKYLIILLAGIKELAQIRGYTNVTHHVDAVSETKATVTCHITFVGNYETDGVPITFSDVGSASIDSTTGFGKYYLESVAANRAFVRAVRNFLGIHIVADDELKDIKEIVSEQPENQSTKLANRTLEKRANELSLTFEQIKKGCQDKYKSELKSDPDEWQNFSSIPSLDCLTICGKLDKKSSA